MKSFPSALALSALLSLPLGAADGKKHILALGAAEGWAHDATSHAMFTMAKIGERSGLFDVRFHTDMRLVTKKKLGQNRKNLDFYDAVFFYTQGDLPLTDDQKADLMRFVRQDGKGILVAHSGTDSFRESWPEYVDMVGGAFLSHPWHQKFRVRLEDRGHPISKHFPQSFEITDELYQLNRYSREKVRVLMSVDVASIDLTKEGVQRTDKDFALAWVRRFGKGRVFTTVLGHRETVWDRDDIRKMWLEAARWVFGITDGETESLPLPSEQ